MRILALVLVSLLSVCSYSIAQESSDTFTLRHVLQRYTDTYGGLHDAKKLTSISAEGVSVQNGEKYRFLLRKKRPSSIRYRLDKGETTLVTGYNGRIGWLQMTQGEEVSVETLSGKGLEALAREAEFESPLYRHLEKQDSAITLEGRKSVDGKQTYALKVLEDNGQMSRYFLSVVDAHLLRVDRLDAEGRIALQTFYRDYRDVDGYPFAFEIENRAGKKTISLVRINKIQVNPGILSFYFEDPRK